MVWQSPIETPMTLFVKLHHVKRHYRIMGSESGPLGGIQWWSWVPHSRGRLRWVACSFLGLASQVAGGLPQRGGIGTDGESRHALMIVSLKQIAIP
jgi:hypothetical protein